MVADEEPSTNNLLADSPAVGFVTFVVVRLDS